MKQFNICNFKKNYRYDYNIKCLCIWYGANFGAIGAIGANVIYHILLISRLVIEYAIYILYKKNYQIANNFKLHKRLSIV